MLKLIFTLDYEIHGNGDGNPLHLMIEPTYRLMSLLQKYGCRLTIFADIAEIIRFYDYSLIHNEDRFHFLKIKEQLQYAVLNGHDVQLHIHSSWFGAEYRNDKWEQSWHEYDFASLGFEKINARITECRIFLEDIIREKVPAYRCHVFRAANWAMQPTSDIVKALTLNGIDIDSSVYKNGRQNEWVNYDYSHIYDSVYPYRASSDEISNHDPDGSLWEFPIYCEQRIALDFISPVRLFRIIRAMFHRHAASESGFTKDESGNRPGKADLFQLSVYFPRKFDFNQLTGGQMIRQLKKIKPEPDKLPYVTLIGHSKSFIRYNFYTLNRFLKFIYRNRSSYKSVLFPASDELQN